MYDEFEILLGPQALGEVLVLCHVSPLWEVAANGGFVEGDDRLMQISYIFARSFKITKYLIY